jgi:hypothetical protein
MGSVLFGLGLAEDASPVGSRSEAGAIRALAGDGFFCDFNPDNPSGCNDLVTPGRTNLFLDPFNPPPLYATQSGFSVIPRGTLLRPFDPNLLLGRGIFTGPGRAKFDVALRKTTRLDSLKAGMSLEFRAEFFNIFNHTNLADPEVNILSPQFGEITATSTSSRQIQLALKLAF